MTQPPPKFIDLVTKSLDTSEWPLPEVDNTIPRFNYEIIKVNKQVSHILVHQLKKVTTELELHPKFASVIVSEKYHVHVGPESSCVAKLWETYLEEIDSGQVCQRVSTPQLEPNNIPHRAFGFLEEPVKEYSIGNESCSFQHLSLKPISCNVIIQVPVILQPRQPLQEPSLPCWECNNKINLFDLVEENLDSKMPRLTNEATTLLLKQHNLVNKYSSGLELPVISPDIGNPLTDFDFVSWKSPDLARSYDMHQLNLFLFERDITHSRKYMVQPTATPYQQENKSAEYILQSYTNQHFDTKPWHLSKYQLIVEMEWKPITSNIKTLQSHFLYENIDSKVDTTIQPMSTVSEDGIKLGPCVVEDTLVLDYPHLQEQTTTTQLENDNAATNLATYHDDTDALVKLVATKKRKLNSKMVDIPQELALLSFLHPNKEATKPDVEEDTKENTSTELNAPQYSVFFDSSFSDSTKEYQFASNQYIALTQSFWNKDYTTAKTLSEKLCVIEVKFGHAVDIVINTTSAIYTTSADLLIQGDGKSTEFLILEEILTMKQHFHRLYIVAIVNTPSFVDYAGPKLAKLQLICLSLNINLLFVSQEDVLLWCLEIIHSESPQLIDEPLDLENQHCVFLCECGLTYFQSREILKMTSLDEFITCTVEEKLKKFKDLVTPELLVSSWRVENLMTPLTNCLFLV
ncbi:hypothetical protein KGF57_004230 [Candida theae]|uniref:Uncharacterized protein n=1 Tax=Candida theae TaxID=1198502 RepID=A0AAD5BBI3_9ASCO|nr:uncharacterized protein KGF57_004230 [Candida theae]KAI5950682.1 hypothetical protein KGF57_004230 [Candida theae]